MQVAGRIVEFTVGRRLRPLTVGTLAFGLLALALALLTQVRGVWIAALAFAALYGWSNGVMTIVRGTVPAELFGQRGFGALLGRLAQPQFIARAIAPLAVTLVFAIDPDRTVTLYTLAGVGLAALAAYQLARAVERGSQRRGWMSAAADAASPALRRAGPLAPSLPAAVEKEGDADDEQQSPDRSPHSPTPAAWLAAGRGRAARPGTGAAGPERSARGPARRAPGRGTPMA